VYTWCWRNSSEQIVKVSASKTMKKQVKCIYLMIISAAETNVGEEKREVVI